MSAPPYSGKERRNCALGASPTTTNIQQMLQVESKRKKGFIFIIFTFFPGNFGFCVNQNNGKKMPESTEININNKAESADEKICRL